MCTYRNGGDGDEGRQVERVNVSSKKGGKRGMRAAINSTVGRK